MDERALGRHEVKLIWTIDRAEVIDHIYSVRDGALVLRAEHYDVRGWSQGQIEGITPQLYAAHDRGAAFVGLFDGQRLVGVAVVDTPRVGVARDLVQLLFLHVSSGYRDRGLGARLFRRAAQIARERGARGLYVSATPSEHTVRFYQRMGCALLAEPDPALLALEPEDIHFERAV